MMLWFWSYPREWSIKSEKNIISCTSIKREKIFSIFFFRGIKMIEVERIEGKTSSTCAVRNQKTWNLTDIYSIILRINIPIFVSCDCFTFFIKLIEAGWRVRAEWNHSKLPQIKVKILFHFHRTKLIRF